MMYCEEKKTKSSNKVVFFSVPIDQHWYAIVLKIQIFPEPLICVVVLY